MLTFWRIVYYDEANLPICAKYRTGPSLLTLQLGSSFIFSHWECRFCIFSVQVLWPMISSPTELEDISTSVFFNVRKLCHPTQSLSFFSVSSDILHADVTPLLSEILNLTCCSWAKPGILRNRCKFLYSSCSKLSWCPPIEFHGEIFFGASPYHWRLINFIKW